MMNIHEASHVKPLLEKLIAQDPNWKETLMKDYKLKWVSCNIDDEDLIQLMVPKGKLVNRYPNAKGLAHKDTFSSMMKFATQISKEEYDFVPPTFSLPGKYEA